MDQTMKAVQLEKQGSQPIVMEIPIPSPGKGQVLVQMDSAPINPSDIAFLNGTYASAKPYPCVPGAEGSGIVISSGQSRNIQNIFSEGELGQTLIGKKVALKAGAGQYGTYAEYIVTDASGCLPLNDDFPLPEAAGSFVNPLTVIGMLDLVRRKQVKAVIHTAAASQLGRMMVRYFQQNGVKVINIVRSEEQVQILQKEGAEFILNSSDQDFGNKIKDLAQAQNATIFFDAVAGQLTGVVLEQMPNGSTVYIYGGLSGNPLSSLQIGDFIFRKKKVRGFWLPEWVKSKTPEQMGVYLQELRDNLRTYFKTVVAKEFTIDQFHEALAYYKKNMTEGKVLIRPRLDKQVQS